MLENDQHSDEQTPQVKENRTGKFSLARVALLLLGLVSIGGFLFWYTCLRMPGESASGSLSPVTSDDRVETKQELERYVAHLSETIGERNLGRYQQLCNSADYVEKELKSFGYTPERQVFQVRELDCFNIDVEIKGSQKPDEIVIVGGHYDSVIGTPGANDNASGTASMLVLARHFAKYQPEKTLRFVAWTNEEPPYFQNEGEMGSWVYAKRCRQRGENIVAVISLETMGYFTDEEDSQNYPAPLSLFYPSTGNFIGFVSNLNSRQLQRRVIKTFRDNAEVPSEGASLPESLPGVGWSDHWSFWQEGYTGIMVTDTAPFRYPHYHDATDTPDKVDFKTLAKVVEGLVFVIEDLVKDN